MDDNVNNKNETVYTTYMTTIQEVPTWIGNRAHGGSETSDLTCAIDSRGFDFMFFSL